MVPIDAEQYPWPDLILDRLQNYAFTKGFTIGPQWTLTEREDD